MESLCPRVMETAEPQGLKRAPDPAEARAGRRWWLVATWPGRFSQGGLVRVISLRDSFRKVVICKVHSSFIVRARSWEEPTVHQQVLGKRIDRPHRGTLLGNRKEGVIETDKCRTFSFEMGLFGSHRSQGSMT